MAEPSTPTSEWSTYINYSGCHFLESMAIYRYIYGSVLLGHRRDGPRGGPSHPHTRPHRQSARSASRRVGVWSFAKVKQRGVWSRHGWVTAWFIHSVIHSFIHAFILNECILALARSSPQVPQVPKSTKSKRTYNDRTWNERTPNDARGLLNDALLEKSKTFKYCYYIS